MNQFINIISSLEYDWFCTNNSYWKSWNSSFSLGNYFRNPSTGNYPSSFSLSFTHPFDRLATIQSTSIRPRKCDCSISTFTREELSIAWNMWFLQSSRRFLIQKRKYTRTSPLFSIVVIVLAHTSLLKCSHRSCKGF